MEREDWLNGLKREGDRVMVFPTIRCVGCGNALGVVCYIPGDEACAPKPDFPFDEATCPLCEMRKKLATMPPEPKDRLLERMNTLRAQKQG